jgi:Flp pilus assembly protein TadD
VGWKRPLFALVALLLFFGSLELLLLLAGVETLWSERDPFQGFSERVRVYELDPQQRKYHTSRRAVLHSFNYQEFGATRPANGFRFFVLGGSSAYGFPWGAQIAFTRVLGTALSAVWPARTIEAVNAAGMSYGSHRLRILTRELLDYDPDLLVVYEGHNEFVERRFFSNMINRRRELDVLRRTLYRWRTYSWLTRLFEKGRDARTRAAGDLLGLDVVREYSLEVDEAEKAEVSRMLGENLRAILDRAERAGVGVVLCTVPSNLEDWAPNQSFFPAGMGHAERQSVERAVAGARGLLERADAAAALAQLEPLRTIAPGYAELHYRLGQAHAALERWDEARVAFVRARDLDGKPSRATSEINETIRRVAAERGAPLVDVERVFERASPHGIPGFDLFEDYVHPKPHAHRLIALELWKVFQERGLLGEARQADPDSFWQAIGHAPDADAVEERPAAMAEASTAPLLFNLAVVLENQGLHEQAMEKYRACLALDPRYHVARANLGRLLLAAGRSAEAADQYRQALQVEPRHLNSLLGLGEALSREQRAEEAREVLERATRIDGRSAPAWDGLGTVLAQQGRHVEAESAFRRAAQLDPENAMVMANLGFSLLFQNKAAEAAAAFRSGIALQRDNLRCRNGLAAALTEQGQLAEAERLFRETLAIEPQDSFARGGLDLIEKRRRAG